MKRFVILLSVLILAFSNPMAAQVSAGAGYLKTHVSGDNDTGSGDGFYMGLSYRIPLIGSFSLAPGLYFTRIEESGGAFVFDDTVIYSDYFIEKALVVPLNLQWSVDFPYGIRGLIHAGPSVQYGLQCQSPSGSYNVPDKDIYDEDYGFAHRRWNVLAGAGLGLSFPFKATSRLFVTAGWDYGFVNLFVNPNLNSNRSLWKVGLGLEF